MADEGAYDKVPAATGFSLSEENIAKTGAVWKPTYIQYRPMLGIVSLGLTVACMMASFAVLWISNGKPVGSSVSQLCVKTYI